MISAITGMLKGHRRGMRSIVGRRRWELYEGQTSGSDLKSEQDVANRLEDEGYFSGN